MQLLNAIGDFPNDKAIQITLDVLQSKFKKHMVAPIELYIKNINIYTNDVLVFNDDNIYTQRDVKNYMSYKEFKSRFVYKRVDLKHIYREH